eukprot:CAMPEP_0196821984 /NCGR_PEP_ID=MMETSP1362-20130617/81758_1 /TAXON_ID=163516 /ORGANISM="Leptocylindrus danicus, Strain CCMP1856" /LENGTH=54 /DNA_ID=CAMNT_0042201393 /DNA_START=13 /DNA_END=174 /DNA_ORIENTATION=-
MAMHDGNVSLLRQPISKAFRCSGGCLARFCNEDHSTGGIIQLMAGPEIIILQVG